MFKKVIAVLMVCTVILSSAISVSAVFSSAENHVLNNNDFAKKTAEIVNFYDNPDNGSKPNALGESLRIIGRATRTDYSFSGLKHTAYAMCSDGRFILQFGDYNSYNNALNILESEKNIIYAEPDCLISVASEESDEDGNLNEGVSQLGTDAYSKYLAEDDSLGEVTVAIVDTGVQRIEPLEARLVDGYDFVDNDSDAAMDVSSDSHGTFLAGIVADCAKIDKVKIMPVRVIKSKTGYLSNVTNGIRYAADNGADVINISLSGTLDDCSSIDDALAYADSKNATVVVCAGNYSKDTANICPAHIESAITVSSVDSNLNFASYFSNCGNEVDVCAPGIDIYSYGANGKIKTLSGTSMSAAFISAGSALFRLHHPECTPSQVQESIKESCIDLGEEGFDIYYGYGFPQFGTFIEEEIIYVEGITIGDEQIFAEVGDVKKLNPVITPSNATNPSFVWKTSDSSVAYVDSDNNLFCVSAGVATVKAVTVDGGFSAEAVVTVSEKYVEPEIVSVSIRKNPDKTVYTYKIDTATELSGIELEVVYSDGSKKTVSDTGLLTATDVSVDNTGKQTVEVEYEGFKVSYDVSVEYAWWQWIIRILLLGFIWY